MQIRIASSLKVLITIVSLLVPSLTFARTQAGDPGDFGVGGLFGSPTGLSFKYWVLPSGAVDGALAWKFGDPDHFQIHSDYLFHYVIPRTGLSGRLPVYFGGGLRVLTGDDSEAGIRFPIGLAYLFAEAPVELFAEVAPVLRFAPDTGSDIDGGVGVRYYFVPGL